MRYYRSYFEKNNTLLSNNNLNTAKSPVTNIFYGSDFSRFIFKIDLSDLRKNITNGEYVLNNQTKHFLHLTNTIFGDTEFLGKDRVDGISRLFSFDLILFKLTEEWDEGVGYDYTYTVDVLTGLNTHIQGPSNWFFKSGGKKWSANGAYTTPIILKTIHFDNGNENINIDVTEVINNIINNNETDYGFGLAFLPTLELLDDGVRKGVSFFTKYTQTFFEPYLQTVFNDRVTDNRADFIVGTNQKLYLYVSKNGNYVDLDFLPTVDILDSNKNQILLLSNTPTKKIRKGIYEVDFDLSGVLCDGKRFFYDVWKNLSINGISQLDVTQKFVPKPFDSVYQIGENKTHYDLYNISVHGIKQNEKVKSGTIRKVSVLLKRESDRKFVLTDELQYRMYIVDGKNHINIFDWTYCDKTNENSFLLDTSFLIQREYTIEVRVKLNNETILSKVLDFEIV